MSKFFDELMESVQEMDEILRGEKSRPANSMWMHYRLNRFAKRRE